MSIRDERFRLTQDAINIAQDIDAALQPILERSLECGISLEEFYFLVSDSASLLILTNIRHELQDMKG